MNKKETIKRLYSDLDKDHHILGIAVGSGLSALNSVKGGADLLLLLNSGKFRQMGVSSLAGYLANKNSNEFTMEFAKNEILPLRLDVPLIFGFNATDPTIDIQEYLSEVKRVGFSGINNYPTVGLIDGVFANALEESGISFEKEVEAMKIAIKLDLFTIAFVFNNLQAKMMADVGVDVICVHLGFTKGGELGAKKGLSLVAAKEMINSIFNSPDVHGSFLKAAYGGPIIDEKDIEFIYKNTSIQGYIGGSTFERIPYEKSIKESINKFKNVDRISKQSNLNSNENIQHPAGYVNFVRNYIEINYMHEIQLKDIADSLFISHEYLSRLFKQEIGMSFQSYLITYRIDKFLELIITSPNLSLNDAASQVGYKNYSNFSKIFKKKMNDSPKSYLEKVINP